MSLPHTDPEAKAAAAASHVSTWITPEYEALIGSAVAKARKPRR